MVTPPLYLQHGTYNCYTGPLQCRCDKCSAAMSEYWVKYKGRKGIVNKPLLEILCQECGAVFMGKPHRKYCSYQCRQLSALKKRTCRRCARAFRASEDAGGIKHWLCAACQGATANEFGKCGLCGVRWWSGDGQAFCSEECRNLDAMRTAIVQKDYL